MSPSDNPTKARVAVMGAGAVGSYFGGMLARAGFDVTFIARAAHANAVRHGGLFMDTVTFQERVRAAASADPSGARDADFVFFSVKTLQTEEAARLPAPNLSPHAVVISLQNGVDNVPRIRAASGINALPAVVYVAAALPEPGRVKHSGRGELIVGELRGFEPADSSVPARTARVAELFNCAEVPCKISSNIEADLWTKMVMNCAGNAVTAIAQTSYGHAARDPHSRLVMTQVIGETVAVARAAGVRLPEANFVEMGLKLAEALGEATSSTAQDLARGKRTEIDSLNGYIVRRGKDLGIPTPVSSTLFALVKLIEETSEKRGRPAGTSQ